MAMKSSAPPKAVPKRFMPWAANELSNCWSWAAETQNAGIPENQVRQVHLRQGIGETGLGNQRDNVAQSLNIGDFAG